MLAILFVSETGSAEMFFFPVLHEGRNEPTLPLDTELLARCDVLHVCRIALAAGGTGDFDRDDPSALTVISKTIDNG